MNSRSEAELAAHLESELRNSAGKGDRWREYTHTSCELLPTGRWVPPLGAPGWMVRACMLASAEAMQAVARAAALDSALEVALGPVGAEPLVI